MSANPKQPIEYHAKLLGLSGGQQVISLTGKCRQTLCQWYKNQRQFFDIVLRGCAYPIAINTMEELCRDYKSLCDVDEVDPEQSKAYRRAIELIRNSK
jgi:hypothetical protein